ncbi:MAG: hypothetical protein CMC08_02005 [Flavobacteriaceae bacterium]|nr:hypothetical protein [Flavobacteriaceae bacterium]
MKRLLCTVFVAVMELVHAQVGIGTVTPAASSMLEISSTSDGGNTYKGLMPPRVPTSLARDAINPGYSDFGLLVFVEETGALQIWDGDTWENITTVTVARPELWINEIHYDNTGTDVGEAIEIAGAAGTNLADYQLLLYSGANGRIYDTRTLTGTLVNQTNGIGFSVVNFPTDGIQNGAPDGMALVKSSTNQVIQFLSYEGVFTATEGPANGQSSTNIGVSQGTNTPVGTSLQLSGLGREYNNFYWSVGNAETFGSVNNGQTIQ